MSPGGDSPGQPLVRGAQRTTGTSADWQSEALLAEIAVAFGLDGPRWAETLGGYSAQNVALTASGAEFVLKRVTRAAASDLTRRERAALHLQRHQVATPMPLPSREGTRYLAQKDATYLLFRRAPGAVRHGPVWAPRALENAAATLARVHAAGRADATTPGPRRRPLYGSPKALPTLAELRRLAPHGPSDRAKSALVAASLASKRRLLATQAVVATASTARTTQFVHGDFHNENLLFASDDSVTCVLDLEASYLGDGLDDVVTFAMLACRDEEASARRMSASRHFVAAYRSQVSRLDVDLMAALARHFVMLASSTFLERRLLSGAQGAATLLDRDVRRMDAFVASPTKAAGALLT